MKRFILNLSQPGLVIFITLVAILLANLLNYIISIYLDGRFTLHDVIRSTLIPVVLAPIISWPLFKMTFRAISAEKELTRLTTYDCLTQLFTRRAFLDKAKTLLNTAKEEASSFSVMALDLDHFKSINDNYGHDAGDYALYKFGELIKNLGISNHLCGRMGGEEFAFALINMSLDDTEHFAELIRNKLSNTILIYDGKEIKLTTSIGISSYQSEKELSLHELMVQADKALYQAKRNGRDQTLIYTSEESFNAELQTSS